MPPQAAAATPPPAARPPDAAAAAAVGWPLRRHLLALVLAVLLPTLLFSGALVWRSAAEERGRLQDRARDVAAELVAALDRELADALAAARVLAGSESLAAGDLAAFHVRAREAKRELGAVNVSLRDAQSRQILNTGVEWGAPLPGAARLAPVDRRVEATGRPAISDVYTGLSTAALTYAVVVPLPARDSADGDAAAPRFLSLGMPIDRLQRIVEREVTLPAGMTAGIADAAGTLVARSRDAAGNVGRPAPTRVAAVDPGAREGAAEGRNAEGTENLLVFRRSDLSGWRAGVSLPRDLVAGAERRAALALAALGAGALALGVGAALFVARRLTGAVGALGAAGRALGEDRPVPAVATPLREANEAARAMREGAARLRRVQRVGRVGGFEMDLRTGAARRSPECLALEGMPAGDGGGDDWLERVHPDDRDRAERRLREALDGAAREYAQEFRVVTPSGDVRWIAARGEVERDPRTGEALRLLGAHLDITDLKRAEEALAESEARHRALVEASPQAVWFGRADDGHITYVNGHWRAYTGLSQAESEGEGWLRAVRPDLRDAVAAAWRAAARAGEGWEHEIPFRRASDGAHRWHLARGVPVRGGGGAVLRWVGVAFDIHDRKEAGEALARSEARLAMALEGTSDGLWDWDLATGEVYHSPRWIALLGHAPEEWESTYENWLRHTHPDDAAGCEDTLRRHLAGETAEYRSLFRMRHKDGSWRWMLSRAKAYRDAAGRIVRMVGTHADVTEQREAEARLSVAVATAGLGTWERDLQTGESRWDARLAAMVGLPPERAAEGAARWLEWVHPDDRAKVLASSGEGGGAEVEYRVVPEDAASRGERVFSGRAVLAPGGGRVIGVVRDVTEERRAAAALRESEERLRLASDAGGVGAWELDLRTGARRWSATTYRLFGVPEGAEITPELVFDRLLHPDDRERVRGCVGRRFDPGAGDPLPEEEYRILRLSDGAERVLLSRFEVVADPATGEAARQVGIVRDVTEERAAQAALRESEAFLRRISEVAPSVLYVYDIAGNRNVWASPALTALLGHRVEEIGGMSGELMQRLMHPDDLPGFARHIARVLALPDGEAAEFQYRFRRADGEWVWLLSREMVFRRDAGGTPTQLVGAALDVTARVAAAEALARGEAELRRLNEGLEARVAEEVAARERLWALAEDLFVTADFDGRLLEASDSWTRALGWRAPDLLARNWTSLVHPEDLGEVSARLAEMRRTGRPVRYESRVMAADGSWRRVAWTLATEPDGSRLHGVGRDVTAERAQAEALAEAEQRLAHAQRMEALGQLAGGIAHDFNNVLQAVQGGADLIGRRADANDGDGVRRLARMVREAAERGSSVTRRLLAFSRRGDLRAEAVDAAALLGSLREVLAHTLGAGVSLRLDAAPGLPPLLADKGQLETVLVNLATNARDAMEGAGEIALSASLDERAPPHLLAEGRYVRIAVADDGPGMAPEVLARATEPFFTTKGTGKGTGLGLAMAKGFAEQSGGALAIESAPGEGTAVTLWLPLAPEPPGRDGGGGEHRDAADASPPAPPPREAPRVLLCDDEALVRDVTAEGLEAAGLAVLRAGSAAEAIALLERGERADLLVSDLSMPGTDGVALIREARRQRPGLPAILLTGFVTDAAELAVGGALSGAFSLLRKPVDARTLAGRIAAMLAERQRGEAAPAPAAE